MPSADKPYRQHRANTKGLKPADYDAELDDVYRWLRQVLADIAAIVDGTTTLPPALPLAHDILSVSHGDTTLAVEVNGDLISRQSGAWARLAVGSDDQVLTVVSGVPAWHDVGEWSVLTNGDTENPEVMFDSNGDVIMTYTP